MLLSDHKVNHEHLFVITSLRCVTIWNSIYLFLDVSWSIFINFYNNNHNSEDMNCLPLANCPLCSIIDLCSMFVMLLLGWQVASGFLFSKALNGFNRLHNCAGDCIQNGFLPFRISGLFCHFGIWWVLRPYYFYPCYKITLSAVLLRQLETFSPSCDRVLNISYPK